MISRKHIFRDTYHESTFREVQLCVDVQLVRLQIPANEVDFFSGRVETNDVVATVCLVDRRQFLAYHSENKTAQSTPLSSSRNHPAQ